MTIATPIEAAPDMTVDRALQLNSAMVSLAFEREGLGRCKPDAFAMLRKATLAELAAVGAILQKHEDEQTPSDTGTRTFCMKCDDRLVAAIYAFLHFAVPPAHRPDDDDYLILKTEDRGLVSFLMCGVREIDELEAEAEEAEAA